MEEKRREKRKGEKKSRVEWVNGKLLLRNK